MREYFQTGRKRERIVILSAAKNPPHFARSATIFTIARSAQINTEAEH
jgi:hypothetical protein